MKQGAITSCLLDDSWSCAGEQKDSTASLDCCRCTLHLQDEELYSGIFECDGCGSYCHNDCSGIPCNETDEIGALLAAAPKGTAAAGRFSRFGGMNPDTAYEGDPVIYEGEPIMLAPDESALIPVRVIQKTEVPANQTCGMFNSDQSTVDIAPGIWDTGATEGMVLVMNVTEFEVPLETGSTVAEVAPVGLQTVICSRCGLMDTEAWLGPESSAVKKCESCATPILPEPVVCAECQATECLTAMSYAGCSDCRSEADEMRRAASDPEAEVVQLAGSLSEDPVESSVASVLVSKPSRGLGSKVVARGLMMFSALSVCLRDAEGVTHPGLPRGAPKAADVIEHPIFHIVEEPGGIDYMTDCEVPTEEYYDALFSDMKKRCLLYTSDAADE